jgi:hypothetical protein
MKTTEPISYDSLCWHAVAWDELTVPYQSSYGDPEAALLDRELPFCDEPPWAAEDQSLMEGLLGLLTGPDRLIVTLDAQGFSQSEIAEAVGRTQPSVSLKIAAVRRWVAVVHPLRRALASAPQPEPDAWAECPERRHFWRTLVSAHLPKIRVAGVARLGGDDQRLAVDRVSEGYINGNDGYSLAVGGEVFLGDLLVKGPFVEKRPHTPFSWRTQPRKERVAKD